MPWYALLFAGAVAGSCGWASTFPFDVVKTRMQSSGLLDGASDANPYQTMRSTFVNSYLESGLVVFYHGLAPTLWR